MAKKFRYFQPEYVNRFRCTGGGCLNNCCERNWDIDIDNPAYKKYRSLKPAENAKKITSHIEFDDKKGKYMLKGRPCPFLTENKMCGLQLEYGEEYLSQTCATYPRRTHQIGNFFERSLTLTCPAAAERILFNLEPMRFEFLEVPDKIHSKHGRIEITKLPVEKTDADLIREVQITMITVLQERTLSIDQRLILLGLFLDRLQEYQTEKEEKEVLLQLIAGYRSKEFLTGDARQIIQHFDFDAQRFITFMIKFISYTVNILRSEDGQRFIKAFEEILGIKPDKNNRVNLVELSANYEGLSEARKAFLENHSPFLENYLVNELFHDFYPWRFITENLTKNYAVFLISYKIFELMTFAAVHSGLNSKEDLLQMVDWFMMKTDHNPNLYKRFLELLTGVDDTYTLMMTLL